MAKQRKLIADTGNGTAPEGEQPTRLKKRKGKFLKTFLITLAIIVGVIALLIGGGLIAGNLVMKNMFGVSLFDTLAAVGDLGNYDRERIVTNAYDDEDADAFYAAANDALYFEDGVLNDEYVSELLDEAVSGDRQNMVQTLMSVMSLDNFDEERLSGYTGWQEGSTSDSSVEMTDREFAAFLDELFLTSGVIESYLPAESADTLSQVLGETSISDLVGLEQIVLTRGADMTDERAAALEAVDGHAYLTLTMSLDIKQTINSMLPYLDAQAGFPVSGFGWLIDWLMPDMTYISATLDLDDKDYGVRVELNSLSEETCEIDAPEALLSKYADGEGKVTKMERLFIVVEAISGYDLNAAINDAVSGTVMNALYDESGECVISQAVDLGSLRKTEEGNAFDVDVFGLVATVLNAQTGADATASDIVVLMQAIVCTQGADGYADAYEYRSDLYYDPESADLEAALKACGFDSIEDVRTEDDYYRLKEAYGDISYKTMSVALDPEYVNVFEREFLDELERAYCLDLTKRDGNGDPVLDENGNEVKYTFSEISDLFGMTSGGATQEQQDLIDLIDSARLAAAAASDEDATLRITDRMLGAIVSGMTDSLLPEDYAGYGVEMRTLSINKVNGHDYVTIVMSVDAKAVAELNAPDLVDLMPGEFALGVTVDMTPGLSADERDDISIYCFNGITVEGDADLNGITPDVVLDAVRGLIPSFDIDGMLSGLSDGVNELLANMTEVMPSLAFVPSESNAGFYEAEFPSLFDLTADALGLTDETLPESERVTGDELKGALDYLVNYVYTGETDTEGDYEDMIKSVQRNYYVADQLTDFDSLFAVFEGGFDSTTLRLNEAVRYSYSDGYVWYNGMMYDPRAAEDSYVAMTESDLTAIIREELEKPEYESVAAYAEVIDSEITAAGTITLRLRIDVREMLGDYASVFEADYIYADVTADTTRVMDADTDPYYESRLEINGQGEGDADFDATMRMLDILGADSFDMDEIVVQAGRAVYSGMSTLSDVRISVTYADGEIILPDFWTYAMTLLDVDDTVYTAEDMKAALQGIRPVETTDGYYVGEGGERIQPSAHNFDEAGAIVNAVGAMPDITDLTPDASGNVTLSDTALGAVLADRVRNDETLAELGSLVQLSALAAGEKSAPGATMYAFADGFGDGVLDNAKDYLLLTFRTDVAALFDAAGAGDTIDLDGVLPDSLYMTVVYERTDTGVTMTYLRVNGMTDEVQTLLIEEICGYADFAGSVSAQNERIVRLLGGIVDHIEMTAAADGVGNVTVPLAELVNA